VKAGDLRAVDRLLKVLERLDQYHRAAAATRDRTKDDGEFKKKLADLVRRARATNAAREQATRSGAAAAAGPGSAGERPSDAVSKFFR
jgi:hypothetical protein